MRRRIASSDLRAAAAQPLFVFLIGRRCQKDRHGFRILLGDAFGPPGRRSPRVPKPRTARPGPIPPLTYHTSSPNRRPPHIPGTPRPAAAARIRLGPGSSSPPHPPRRPAGRRVVAEIALASFTGACSTRRLTIVDLPEPLGPDKTTMRRVAGLATSTDRPVTPHSAALPASARPPP